MSEEVLEPVTSMPFRGPEMERLIECNQRLHNLGINKTVRLPTICVIGDQSAGKSSLIEALSMIRIPRAAGCCTRTPLAVSISAGEKPDSPWKCKVIIEERYEYDFGMKNKQPTKANPMGPWVPRQMTTTEFQTTDDKTEVCGLIQAAQQAILSPGTDPASFVPGKGCRVSVVQDVKFSPNVVRLDITEGNWPNLSFVDLPGVFTNTDHRDEYFLVSLVDNLVQQYAQDENSINLLTLPMTNDVANSKARRLIQKIAAEPRTLAVLTKPDRVQDEDALAQFLDKFLEKEDLAFKHGYHVVMMNPDAASSFEEARLKETDFFQQEPWISVDHKFRGRLGVEALREYIRQVLFTKTQDSLPENLQSIQNEMNSVEQKLKDIPPPPDLCNLPIELVRLTTEFSSRMQKAFLGLGQSDRYTLRVEWNEVVQEFRRRITRSRPTLYFQTSNERQRLAVARNKIKKASQMGNLNAASKTEPLEISDDDSPPPSCPKPESGQSTDHHTSKECEDLTYRFKLEDLQQLNRNFDISGVPGQAYPEALQEMMKLSVKKWDLPTQDFMHRTSKLITGHVNELFELVFNKFKNFELHAVVGNWVNQYLQAEIHDAWIKVNAVCAIEQTKPFTLDEATITSEAQRYLDERQARRRAFRMKVMQVEAEAAHVSSKSSAKNRPSESSLPPDEFKTEVEMSAVCTDP